MPRSDINNGKVTDAADLLLDGTLDGSTRILTCRSDRDWARVHLERPDAADAGASPIAGVGASPAAGTLPRDFASPALQVASSTWRNIECWAYQRPRASGFTSGEPMRRPPTASLQARLQLEMLEGLQVNPDY